MGERSGRFLHSGESRISSRFSDVQARESSHDLAGAILEEGTLKSKRDAWDRDHRNNCQIQLAGATTAEKPPQPSCCGEVMRKVHEDLTPIDS